MCEEVLSTTFTKILCKDNTLAKEIKILHPRGFTNNIFLGFCSSKIINNFRIQR